MGSEMCIRDRNTTGRGPVQLEFHSPLTHLSAGQMSFEQCAKWHCPGLPMNLVIRSCFRCSSTFGWHDDSQQHRLAQPGACTFEPRHVLWHHASVAVDVIDWHAGKAEDAAERARGAPGAERTDWGRARVPVAASTLPIASIAGGEGAEPASRRCLMRLLRRNAGN